MRRERDGTGLLIGSLAMAAAPEGQAGLAETHSAVVLFFGDRAYKLKKAVSLGFLDFSTRDAREGACHREVDLNRRIAPDVYLGVADLVGPDGRAFDHLVVMRRLASNRRLSTLVRERADVGDDLRRIARLVAGFHSRAARSEEISNVAGRDACAARWEANAAEMEELTGVLFDAQTAARVISLARRYLAGRDRAFAARIAADRSCDGHGDLLADDIFCLDDGPRILDCIEFDDRLRFGDALADVAFLAMDLERLGRPELATAFLEAYRRFSGDSWPDSLAHHYIAYRAQVRAKVAGLRFLQGVAGSARTARQLLELAADHLECARVRLVVVGGLPGSGKSRLALGVAEALGAVVLRSDLIRKEIAGIDSLTPARAPYQEGIYNAETTVLTYRELLTRARVLLSRGESVVLDATFADPTWRKEARSLAAETASDLDELVCTAPLRLLEARLARRGHTHADPSDATALVARSLAESVVPWPEATVIDTSGRADATRRQALSRLAIAARRPPRAAPRGAGR